MNPLIWNQIPLEDYEKHMQHKTVGQMQLLSELTKKYLERFQPASAMFLGISGGNGLEHIDNEITKNVWGVDINSKYLEATQARFQNKISHLYLENLDISLNQKTLEKVNFLWAALIFEYVPLENGFEFIRNNLQTNGNLIITIQSNNGITSISQTGVESIKAVGQIFQIVESSLLLEFAEKAGFSLMDSEENFLPNQKSLKTYLFNFK